MFLLYIELRKGIRNCLTCKVYDLFLLIVSLKLSHLIQWGNAWSRKLDNIHEIINLLSCFRVGSRFQLDSVNRSETMLLANYIGFNLKLDMNEKPTKDIGMELISDVIQGSIVLGRAATK